MRIGGKPAILLDVAARRFTFFGVTLLPTDTLLLALFMVSVFLTIFWVTALLGRVWCGWACPQTVYLEFVYRPLERFFTGTPGRAAKGWLQASGAGTILKYAVYLVISLFLAHTFLSYFVGVERLGEWVRRSPLEHPSSFLIVMGVTAAMMFNFSYFREQTCIVACPYGRFQSVMLDRQSMIISYDRARGEPRGKRRADLSLPQATPAGDCVDCGLCVRTCPTGIDIRNGLQMECVGCAQCIDACDSVMQKLERPRGLIRYTSEAALKGERPRLGRPRVVAYPLVVALLMTLFGIVLAGRGPAYVAILRGMGRPFNVLPSGEVSNPVRVKIIHRGDTSGEYRLEVIGSSGARIETEANPVRLKPRESVTVPGSLIVPASAVVGGRCEVHVRVTDHGQPIRDVRYRMMGPAGTASPQHDDDVEHKDAEDEETEKEADDGHS